MNTYEQALILDTIWKANAERNAKIEAEKHPDAESMPINVRWGTRIVFMGRNGYEYELSEAKQALTVGGTYTVERTIPANYTTDVELQEVPGRLFNTVMFREAQ